MAKQSYDDLVKEYRKLAKRADQRLLRLEKISGQKNFKQVKQWAYKNAVTDALQWGANPKKPRFNIEPPKDKNGDISPTMLQAKIRDIQYFLDKPSSTKAGIIKVYQKKADTLNKKYADYNLNLSWSDVGDLFESRLYKKLDDSFTSGTMIKAIATMKNNEAEILQDFAKKRASHIKTEDNDMVVDAAIKKMTSYYKKDVKALLKMI